MPSLTPTLTLTLTLTLTPTLTLASVQVLSVLPASSPAKLRAICASNGLDGQGPKSTLIERLIDHIAAAMRAQRGGP